MISSLCIVNKLDHESIIDSCGKCVIPMYQHHSTKMILAIPKILVSKHLQPQKWDYVMFMAF